MRLQSLKEVERGRLLQMRYGDVWYYVVGSKCFQPDIQTPRQMEKCCEGYIVPSMVRLMYQLKSVLK